MLKAAAKYIGVSREELVKQAVTRKPSRPS
jgi:hypothetical protein